MSCFTQTTNTDILPNKQIRNLLKQLKFYNFFNKKRNKENNEYVLQECYNLEL